MTDKKNPSRFTIQFNHGDPKQQSVAELLEQQGRHKAQFITNAVLHYINCPETPETAPPQTVDKALLEKLVLEILERQGGKVPVPAENLQVQEQPASETNSEIPSELEKLFGKDGLSAITSTLSAFQMG